MNSSQYLEELSLNTFSTTQQKAFVVKAFFLTLEADKTHKNAGNNFDKRF